MNCRARILVSLTIVCSTQLFAANIQIKNNDGAGEGFNDPTAASSIPTQKGNNPGTTLGQLRLNVFKEAARVWAGILKSNITITVGATFDPLACNANSGTLGSAGATSSRANFTGSVAGVAYGISQSESLANANLNGTNSEISAQFNSDVDAKDSCLGSGGFYYGLDGKPPAGTVSLFPVVLHEIAHGLGFSSMADAGPGGSGGFIGAGGLPDAFSRNLQDQSTGKSWDQMSNAERKTSATNEPKLVWKGPQVTADRGMHLGPAPEFVINSPGSIAGTFPTVLGEEPSIVIPNNGITAGVIDGQTFTDRDNDLADGCSQIARGGSFTGKIVMFDKSPSCTAAFPALFSQWEGAVAVIIVATTPGGLPDMSGQISNQEITIPYVGVTKAVGASLRANLGTANVTIRNSKTNLLGTRAGRLVMYAPAAFEPGSSVSHWSKSASPSLLMEPVINSDLVHKSVDITKAAFKDIGWPLISAASGVPGRPTGVRATDGSFSDRVRVTFNTVAGATVYRVFRCTTTGQTCGTPVGFPKTGTFDDRKGVAGVVYFYRVRACNATGCGKFSLPNSGFSSAAPARPTGVKATDGTFSDKVRVTFNKVNGATVYRIFRCTTSGQTCGTPIGFPKGTVFDDTKGVSGTVYYYRVRACTATTCGKFSLPNTGFRKSGPAVPARPTMVRASDGTFAQRVRVTWNKVPAAFVYRVFRCPMKTGDCGLPVGFPKNPVFDDFKGTSGVIYYYRVRACTQTTCGKFSVQNPGHRGTLPSLRAEAVGRRLQTATPIPVLNGAYGRGLMILLLLAFGLLFIRGRLMPARE